MSLLLDPSTLNNQFLNYKLSSKKLHVLHYSLENTSHVTFHSTCFQLLEYLSKKNNLFHYQENLLYFDKHMNLIMFNQNGTQILYSFPQVGPVGLFSPQLIIVNHYFFVSTGHDHVLYILKIDEGKLQYLHSIEIPAQPNESNPPTILDACINQEQFYVVSMHVNELNDANEPKINLCLLRVQKQDITVTATLSGKHVPQMCVLNDDLSLRLLSSCSFHLEGSRILNLEQTAQQPGPCAETPAYIWTQTQDDVTIHLSFEKHHSKHNLQVAFQSDGLTVKNTDGIVLGGSLFDAIVPMESIWTLEEGLHLTIYIAKKNKSRWLHVFNIDDGVLETLDSATLRAYTDRLEKYTGVEEGVALKQMLAMTEQAEAIDFESNTSGYFVYKFDSTLSCYNLTHQNTTSGMEFLCRVYDTTKFVLKADVDGAVFEFYGKDQTRNIDSFTALSYIRASKREASLVFLSSDLDYCAIIESKRYLYLYAHPQGDSTSSHYCIDLWQGQGAITQSLIIGAHLLPNCIWILKEDSIVRVDF